jgi:flagellin
VRELAVQAKSDTNGTTDVARLQEEANALFTEISRVSSQTMYNNKAYLGKDADKPILIQVGYNDRETIELTARNIAAHNLGTIFTEDGESQAAIAGKDGNRLHTLAKEAAGASGTDVYHVATGGDIASLDSVAYTFVYGGTTLEADFTGEDAPANATELVAALIGDGDAGDNAAAYALLDIGIAADGANIDVTWEGYGAQTDLGITAAWATWTTTTTGDAVVAATDKVDEAFLSIKSENALKVISDAIDQVATYKADWGASQNRLGYTVSNLMNVVEFTSAARSRIQDADFAVEAANLAKAQVLQQTGTAMLAQANAAPQLALQLLK